MHGWQPDLRCPDTPEEGRSSHEYGRPPTKPSCPDLYCESMCCKDARKGQLQITDTSVTHVYSDASSLQTQGSRKHGCNVVERFVCMFPETSSPLPPRSRLESCKQDNCQASHHATRPETRNTLPARLLQASGTCFQTQHKIERHMTGGCPCCRRSSAADGGACGCACMSRCHVRSCLSLCTGCTISQMILQDAAGDKALPELRLQKQHKPLVPEQCTLAPDEDAAACGAPDEGACGAPDC